MPPTLAELKAKWFIDPSGAGFPPPARHAGTAVAVSTDGNKVTPLIDGQAYQGQWCDSIQAMTTGANPSGCEVWHTGWRFEGVKTKGSSVPASDALDVFNAADTAGVNLYGMLSRHAPGLVFNNPTVIWLRAHNIWKVVMDNRFPPAGSGHQKFCCMRDPANPHILCGSIDISKTRWDRPAHADVDPERDPTYGKPTHDTGVMVQGPAVADVETSFKERWNDSTRTFGLDPLLPPLPLITAPVSSPGAVGSHSVQVLHTYGRTSATFGYSWSPAGEFTVWASYINAIKTASQYIYIEDQYFLPFDWPPCFTRTGPARDSDLIYQLGEAIKRGVKVLAVVPSNAEDSTHLFQKYQRDKGIEYLLGVAAAAGAGGDFVVASLTNGTSDIYVHSKLMIVDDELVEIGSTNIGQRSMTFDSELHLAIVDEAGAFAKEFRKALWSEHLGVGLAAVDDPIAGYALFKAAVAAAAPTGHTKAYPYSPPGAPPFGHETAITKLIDPYAGPPR